MGTPGGLRQERRLAVALLVAMLWPLGSAAFGQDKGPEKESDTSVALSAEVINPTTLLWQMQLEEFAIFDTEGTDGFAQNFRLRAIIPVSEGLLIKVPQLIRVIAFVNTAPGGPTGLGDLTLNQFFILGKKSWGEWGVGWDLTAPTAGDPKLGSEQWQIGPSATITFTRLGNWQMYWVWQNFFSVSGNDQYGSLAVSVLQPNIFYTWANGVYVGMEPLWKLDYETGDVAIPLNFRVGYIFQRGGYKFNTYVEPEWMTYRSDGTTLDSTDFGVRFGFRIFLPE
jgi:hypothetical protein